MTDRLDHLKKVLAWHAKRDLARATEALDDGIGEIADDAFKSARWSMRTLAAIEQVEGWYAFKHPEDMK